MQANESRLKQSFIRSIHFLKKWVFGLKPETLFFRAEMDRGSATGAPRGGKAAPADYI